MLLLALSCVEYGVDPVRDDLRPQAGEAGCPPQVPDCDAVDPADTGSMPECVLEHATARAAWSDPDCAAVPAVPEPFALQREVHYPVTGAGVGVAPAIADLDGDGAPEMVWTEWVDNRLTVARADGDGLLWSKSGIHGGAGVALGDVDDDGGMDIVALSLDNRAVVFDREGQLIWASEPLQSVSIYAQPVLADVNGDGLAEVVMDTAVLSGQDGSIISERSADATARAPLAVDLDGDGSDEVLVGNLVLRDGEVAWATPTIGSAVFGVPVQLDDDPAWEVVFAASEEVLFHDDDGRLLDRRPLVGHHPGPPCVGDFDGDGAVEIGIPTQYKVSLYERDGSVSWVSWAQDSSGLAGCAAFDLDADGDDELIYADHHDLLVLDGRDGQQLARWAGHDSFTIWEAPAIADVDADGSAEICFGSNNGDVQGVTCLGHPDQAWPGAGAEWSYNHQDGDRVRGRQALFDPRASDVTGRLVDLCVDCSGSIELSLQVWNQGAMDQPGTPYTIVALHPDGESVIQQGALALAPPGTADASHTLAFPAQQAGALGFAVLLDPQDLHGECDVSNNRIDVIAVFCP